MPNSILADLAISLEGWDPVSFDPKPEDAKTPKEVNKPPVATPYATPKDPNHRRPATLKEGYFNDNDYLCVQFLDSLPFYLVRAGEGYFTPKYHITRPLWEEQRDEILERWRQQDLRGRYSRQLSPSSSLSSSQMVESGPIREVKDNSKALALQQREVDANPRPIALRVSIKFSNQSFTPIRHMPWLLPENPHRTTPPPDLCVNIFYNGEFVSSRVINNRYKPKDAEHHTVKAFSGRCVGNKIETPFIMLPKIAQDQESQSSPKITGSNAQRWKRIGEKLLVEADNWKSSDAENKKSNTEGYKSLMTKYLEDISKLKMPVDMEETQLSGLRKFGIIDVIVTTGISNISEPDVSSLVLKEPRRLLSAAPVGKNGLVCTVDLGAKPKLKKLSFWGNDPTSAINTGKVDPNVRLSATASFEMQEIVPPGTSLPLTLDSITPKTHERGEIESSRVEGVDHNLQAPFLSTRSHRIAGSPITLQRAVTIFELPPKQWQAMFNPTKDSLILPRSTPSQKTDDLDFDFLQPSSKRRKGYQREHADIAKPSTQNKTLLETPHPSHRVSKKPDAIKDGAPALAQTLKTPLMPGTMQPTNSNGGRAQTKRTISIRSKSRRKSTTVEYAAVQRPAIETTHNDVLKDSYDNHIALTPGATQEANKENGPPSIRVNRNRENTSTGSATNSAVHSKHGVSSAKVKHVRPTSPGIVVRSFARVASPKNDNEDREVGSQGNGAIDLAEPLASFQYPSLPAAAPPDSISTREVEASKTVWKPSSLNDDSVLTFGTKVYNAENYTLNTATGLAHRAALQEKEALFATTGVVVAVRFVVDP